MSDDLFSGNAARQPRAPKPSAKPRPAANLQEPAEYTAADIEVLEGLEAGDQVVALAGTFVRDGDAVTAVALKSAEGEG